MNMMIWITIIAMLAACLSALYTILTHRQAQHFAHLDLRIRVRDLNRKLHEDKTITSENNQTAVLFMNRAFALAANAADVEESLAKERKHLASQTERLKNAILNLPPLKRTFADMDDNHLEEQLLELMSVERLFNDVNGSSKMWQSEYEVVYQRVNAI